MMEVNNAWDAYVVEWERELERLEAALVILDEFPAALVREASRYLQVRKDNLEAEIQQAKANSARLQPARTLDNVIAYNVEAEARRHDNDDLSD